MLVRIGSHAWTQDLHHPMMLRVLLRLLLLLLIVQCLRLSLSLSWNLRLE